jgi:predicted anti-sigma-YlaC factor YlaD
VASRACDRETDILRAVGSGHVDDDVRGHIAECDACADLMAVASAVADDRRALMREAPIPSSALVWWRANLRARQEAARVAVRAATLVQVALIAAAIVVAVVVLGVSLPVIDMRPLLTIPIFAFLAWLILAPVAVYFAVTED